VKSKTIRSTSRTAGAGAPKASPASQRKPARRHAVAEESPATVAAEATERAAPAADETVAATSRPAEQAGRLSHEAVDVLMSSGAALARGFRDVQQVWLGFAQVSLQDGAAVARAMAAARTPRELFQLQSDYARATLDKLMTESGRVSQLSLNAANEAMRPLQRQVGTAMSRLWQRQAA
jgi:phasin family protein